jgi:hypothetical protein
MNEYKGSIPNPRVVVASSVDSEQVLLSTWKYVLPSSGQKRV